MTVIIPTIGRPDYIIDTVRSVLAQSYTRLQILISDNAPTVHTAHLLAAAGIEDERIHIVQHAVRLDFSEHMNACIAQCRGTFLLIVSDDDLITRDYVAEMVAMMFADPQIKICFGRQIRINENDRGLLPHRVLPAVERRVFEGADFLSGTLNGSLDSGLLTYISMFVRREDVVEAGGFRRYPDGSHADNFIVLNLALKGRVALGSGQMFYRVYLDSFGLRTPFEYLLTATRAYTDDACGLLQKTSMSSQQRATLSKLIRRSNVAMLLGRIRSVYRHRLTLPQLFGCMFQVLLFRFQLH